MKRIQNNTSANHQVPNYSQLNKAYTKPVFNSVQNSSRNYDSVELSSNKNEKKKKTIAKILIGALSIGAIVAIFVKRKNNKTNLSAITNEMTTCETNATNRKSLQKIANLTSRQIDPEIPPNIDRQLEELAQRLSDEYESFSKESEEITSNFIFGSKENADKLYDGLKTRTKSKDSILKKLRAKYKSGSLTLTQNFDENFTKAKALINDAYGSRLLLKEVPEQEYLKILEKRNIDQEDFLSQVTKLMKNPEYKINEAYIEVIEELKEIQTKDIFEALLNGIKNKTIIIERFENYGDTLSSYFSKKQIAQLIDAYAESNDHKILTIVSKDATGIIENSQTLPKGVEYIDAEQLLSPETYHTTSENKKIKNLQEAIMSDGAVKKSGYTTAQMDVRQNFSKGTGIGEFQVRGSKVNDFGDVEHIPYDIRQGKITEDDPKYKEIYNIIKNMSDEQYKGYNKYLTEVYTYLRMQELGLNLGKMPVLDNKIGPSIISYEGLLKFAHK